MTIEEQAAALWASFTPNEKHAVRFGMFPAVKMREAERDVDPRKLHNLTCALMDCASKDGGMRG